MKTWYPGHMSCNFQIANAWRPKTKISSLVKASVILRKREEMYSTARATTKNKGDFKIPDVILESKVVMATQINCNL